MIVQTFVGTVPVSQMNLPPTVPKIVHTVETVFVRLLEVRMFSPARQIVELAVTTFVRLNLKMFSCVLKIVVAAETVFVKWRRVKL